MTAIPEPDEDFSLTAEDLGIAFGEDEPIAWRSGGFKLSLEHRPAPNPSVLVYAHSTSRSGGGQSQTVLLAEITPDELRAFPLSGSPGPGYLLPKHGAIKTITLKSPGAWKRLPQSAEEVDNVLAALPIGFGRQAQFGMGLLRKYSLIADEIAEIEGVDEIVLEHGEDVRLDLPRIVIGFLRFEELARALNRIAAKARARSREDRRILSHNELLTAADPRQFPKRVRAPKPGEIYELVAIGARGQMSAADRRVVVEAVRDEAAEIAAKDPTPLLELKSRIEFVALREFAQRIESMLDEGLSEQRWQDFFKKHPFALVLAFPHPVVLFTGQAHVGGATILGTDGSIADFLLSNNFTGNMALVEIKTPATQLLENSPYRNGVYAPYADLTRAMAQMLHQKDRLVRKFIAHKADDRTLWEKHVSAVQCVLIIGSSKQVDDDDRKRSFELFRNSSRDVVVVTFDELLGKLREILKVVTPKDENAATERTPMDGLAGESP